MVGGWVSAFLSLRSLTIGHRSHFTGGGTNTVQGGLLTLNIEGVEALNVDCRFGRFWKIHPR